MRNLSLILLLLLSINLFSQEKENQENAFDFWVGSWTVSWLGKDSTIIKGSNIITKTLDAKVIQENFIDPSTGFKGTSISVYNKKKNEWHQAWADNSGGYYNFIGELDGDKRMFKTIPKDVNGKIVIQRMVFHDISETHFTWDWESTSDGGETWTLNWRINYTKVL